MKLKEPQENHANMLRLGAWHVCTCYPSDKNFRDHFRYCSSTAHSLPGLHQLSTRFSMQ